MLRGWCRSKKEGKKGKEEEGTRIWLSKVLQEQHGHKFCKRRNKNKPSEQMKIVETVKSVFVYVCACYFP